MKRTRPAAAKPAPSHAVPASKPAPSHHQRAVLPPASAYFIEDRHDRTERHVLSVIVDNEPGVLARVIGLFSGRGYNIDSLTVSETEHARHQSRITVVTTGTPMVLAQIRNQLDRMVPVHAVIDLTAEGNPLERELALVKVAGQRQRSGRGAPHRRRLRGGGGRRHHRAFCLPVDRPHRQDRAVHRHHGAARPGRGLPHRQRRAEPRGGGAGRLRRPAYPNTLAVVRRSRTARTRPSAKRRSEPSAGFALANSSELLRRQRGQIAVADAPCPGRARTAVEEGLFAHHRAGTDPRHAPEAYPVVGMGHHLDLAAKHHVKRAVRPPRRISVSPAAMRRSVGGSEKPPPVLIPPMREGQPVAWRRRSRGRAERRNRRFQVLCLRLLGHGLRRPSSIVAPKRTPIGASPL